MAALTERKRTVLIVTAGLPRSGKSTAMNNIFCAEFESNYSAFSVTQSAEARCVDGCKDELIVVDTPGLGATDIRTAKIKSQLLRAVGGLNFVLVYVYSVSPTNAHTEADVTVVKNLQQILGKDIWKKCVVLFSCSDLLREQICPRKEDRESYRSHLQNHAKILSGMLRKACGPHVPKVKVVFDVDLNQQELEEIIAVPVGFKMKRGREAHFLVPDVQLTAIPDVNWRDLALYEIMRKADPVDHGVFLSFAHNRAPLYGALAGGAIGATVGGISGTVAGLAMFGVGAVPGALVGAGVGAAAGVAAGSVAGGTVGVVTFLSKQNYMDNKVSSKLTKLKDAGHVDHMLPPPELEMSSTHRWSRRTASCTSTASVQHCNPIRRRLRSMEISMHFLRRTESLQNPVTQESSVSSTGSFSTSVAAERPLPDSPEQISQCSVHELSGQYVAAEEPDNLVDPEEPE